MKRQFANLGILLLGILLGVGGCLLVNFLAGGSMSRRNAPEPVSVVSADMKNDELANKAGTISYELCCAVSPRIPRVYLG